MAKRDSKEREREPPRKGEEELATVHDSRRLTVSRGFAVSVVSVVWLTGLAVQLAVTWFWKVRQTQHSSRFFNMTELVLGGCGVIGEARASCHTPYSSEYF